MTRRWLQWSGRMVVRHDDAGGAVGHGVRKDFARMNGTAVNKTDGNHADVKHFVGAIDGGAKEMLLFAVRVMPDEGQEIRRRCNLHTFRLDAAASELNRGENQCG